MLLFNTAFALYTLKHTSHLSFGSAAGSHPSSVQPAASSSLPSHHCTVASTDEITYTHTHTHSGGVPLTIQNACRLSVFLTRPFILLLLSACFLHFPLSCSSSLSCLSLFSSCGFPFAPLGFSRHSILPPSLFFFHLIPPWRLCMSVASLTTLFLCLSTV